MNPVGPLCPKESSRIVLAASMLSLILAGQLRRHGEGRAMKQSDARQRFKLKAVAPARTPIAWG